MKYILSERLEYIFAIGYKVFIVQLKNIVNGILFTELSVYPEFNEYRYYPIARHSHARKSHEGINAFHCMHMDTFELHL